MEQGEILVEHRFYSIDFFTRIQYLSEVFKCADKNDITTLP